jgi:hypothetical protein
MFTRAAIRTRLLQQPFHPFRLVTSSGENYEVQHPELLLVGIEDVIVGTPSKDDPTYYDNVSRVAISHVTAMEDLPARSKKGSKSNGKN